MEKNLFQHLENFILNCLSEENLEMIVREKPMKIHDDSLKPHSQDELINYNAYFPYGLQINQFKFGRCYLFIKQRVSKIVYERITKRLSHDYNNSSAIIIALEDKKIVESYNNNKIHILGKKFVNELIRKYPNLYWKFLSSVSDSEEIIDDGETFKVIFDAKKIKGYDNAIEIPSWSAKEMSKFNKEQFVNLVRKGENIITLFIGNGVSIPFGSDSWNEMCDYIFDYLRPNYIDDTNNVKRLIGGNNLSSASMAKSIINQTKFEEALYNCVYRKYEDNMHINKSYYRIHR